MHPARWALTLIALAFVAAMTAPIGAVAAQTPAAPAGGDIIAVVPDSALMFAQVNLDSTSDQMVLARQLAERAGLGDPFEEMSTNDGEFPTDSRVGIVVTSIPEADNIDVADVTVDPASVTDSLDEGGFAVIVSSADAQQVYQSQLDDIQGDADMNGASLTESEYGGVTISAYEPGTDDEYTNPGAVALVGDFVVSASRAVDIHPVIDTFNGDTPSLSTNEHYQQIGALLPADAISHGYLDGPAFLAAAETSAPDALETADPRLTGVLNAWSGYALTAEQDGFRLETKAIASDTAFEMTPIDGSFYDKVPSDALLAVNGTDIDSTGALTMLAFLFASEFVGEDVMATPVADLNIEATQASVFAKAEQMLGFNFKTDLLDHLNGEFGFSVSLSDITAEMPTINALIVSHVDDPAAVSSTMTKISMIVGAALGDQTAVGERDVNGSTVNVVNISDTGVAESVDFGVIGEDLVIGIGTGVDDYANGPASPMSADPNFNAVMEHLPSEYGSLTYVNMPVLLDVVMGFSDSISGQMDMTDADPSCGEYASQAEAQAAYDEDQFENYQLDQDFDGEACEDYFGGGTPAASPAATAHPYANILGMATVTTLEDGVYGSTTFLLIGGK
jgi:hypothetical protein